MSEYKRWARQCAVAARGSLSRIDWRHHISRITGRQALNRHQILATGTILRQCMRSDGGWMHMLIVHRSLAAVCCSNDTQEIGPVLVSCDRGGLPRAVEWSDSVCPTASDIIRKQRNSAPLSQMQALRCQAKQRKTPAPAAQTSTRPNHVAGCHGSGFEART